MKRLWVAFLSTACTFVPERACESHLECVDAFGPGTTCDAAGQCILATRPIPAGCEGIEGPIGVSEAVTDDEVWGCPITYRVDGVVEITGSLSVSSGATIEMGPRAALVVDAGGALDVTGAPDLPVVFTSPSGASAGSWAGIVVTETAGPVAIVDAMVQSAGGALSDRLSPDEEAGIVVLGSATVRRTTIVDSAAHGIRFARGGTPVEFADNTFIETALAPIRIDANEVDRLNGGHTFDEGAVIEVDATVVDHEATWIDLDVPYRLLTVGPEEGLAIGSPVAERAVLTVTEGVDLQLEPGSGIYVGFDGPAGFI
ncbi:MAG: hypothetical protein AAF211_25320, partial [Myxococcota bacterium]